MFLKLPWFISALFVFVFVFVLMLFVCLLVFLFVFNLLFVSFCLFDEELLSLVIK